MSEMSKAVYDSKQALPNKLLQEDGSITDLLGNPVTNAIDTYENKSALPDKWLNPDGTYTTLANILAGAIDTSLFVVVNELPQEGDPEKIYVVPDGEGGFIEYHYVNGNWDPIGKIDNSLPPQVLYWDGSTSTTGIAQLNALYDANQEIDVLFLWKAFNTTTYAQYMAYIPKNQLNKNVRYSSVYGYCYSEGENNRNISYHSYYVQQLLTIDYQNGTVVGVSGSQLQERRYLDTNTNYPTSYTPLYDGSPATKKYVDDSITNAITDAIGGAY